MTNPLGRTETDRADPTPPRAQVCLSRPGGPEQRAPLTDIGDGIQAVNEPLGPVTPYTKPTVANGPIGPFASPRSGIASGPDPPARSQHNFPDFKRSSYSNRNQGALVGGANMSVRSHSLWVPCVARAGRGLVADQTWGGLHMGVARLHTADARVGAFVGVISTVPSIALARRTPRLRHSLWAVSGRQRHPWREPERSRQCGPAERL